MADIGRYETELLEWFDTRHADIMEAIRTGGNIPDEEALEAAITAFTDQFVGSDSAGGEPDAEAQGDATTTMVDDTTPCPKKTSPGPRIEVVDAWPGGAERILRRRINSVSNTKKITRAMELIAATRVARAQQRARAARPYSEQLTGVIENLAAGGAEVDHPAAASGRQRHQGGLRGLRR